MNEKEKCLYCKSESEDEKPIKTLAYYANSKPVYVYRCNDCQIKYLGKRSDWIYSILGK